jgi:Putative beta-barrel porin-2, OmpL-like. bbp2
MTSRLGSLLLALALVTGWSVWPAFAQTPAPAPAPAEPAATTEKKEEEKPKTYWEEHKLFAYIENSYTFNLTGAGRGGTNELRFYDYDEGYTFNMAEFSIKKDPTEKYWWGYGLVVTAGIDAQKNHSLGIFRGDDDTFAFRNTKRFDLQEAYVSARIPLGEGLIVKGGKFVTLLGYEVIESPNNLNFSRGYLFEFAIPLTHTGGLLSYAFSEQVSVTAGVVLGWDNSRNNNDAVSFTGQVATVPVKDLTVNLNWIVGPEQNDNTSNQRVVLDLVANYTGIKNTTLGLNVDYGFEENEALLQSLGTRQDTDARWWGVAGYAAYDFTEWFRLAFRQEFFQDQNGARTGLGNRVVYWTSTLTAQFKIWKGLVGRVEYRHDAASEKVYEAKTSRPDASQGVSAQSKSLDTISLSLFYSFF